LASFGEVAERSFEERKLIALETIAGAAQLWIVSIAKSLDTTLSTDFLSSGSINQTRRGMMREKRMTRKIKETQRCRFRNRLPYLKDKDHDHREWLHGWNEL
jgi:hypothetical protein